MSIESKILGKEKLGKLEGGNLFEQKLALENKKTF